MKPFHTFAIAGLAVLGLTMGACERRAPTANQQGKGYTPSKEPAATTPAPSASSDKQPVAGHETPSATTPAPGEAPPAGTTPAAPAAAMEVTSLYWVSEDGRRNAIDDPAVVTKIQQKLSEAGVYSGPTDGRPSAELEGSIRKFQAKKSLPETGTIDSRTASALNLDWEKMKVDMPEAAKKAGDEIKEDTKKAGEEVKEGAKDVKDFVEGKDKDQAK